MPDRFFDSGVKFSVPFSDSPLKFTDYWFNTMHLTGQGQGSGSERDRPCV